MEKKGRRIGQRIIEACKIVERHGPCHASVVRIYNREVALANMHKNCRRAAELGLMTVENVPRGTKTTPIFSIVKGWREILEKYRMPPVLPKKKKSVWSGVSSVFGVKA